MNESPSPPPLHPSSKGMPVLGWVGLGCGTVLIIAVVVTSLFVGWCKRTVGDISEFKKNPEKAAAEMMVRLNPDVEKVSQDDAKGEMTIRSKDGQTRTMSYKDISEGRFLIQEHQGSTAEFGGADLTDVPVWVPRPSSIKTVGSSTHGSEGNKSGGQYSVTSPDDIKDLEEHFESEAEKLGFNSSRSTSVNADGVKTSSLNYEGSDRKLEIILTGKPGEDVLVNVGYEKTK